MKRTSVTGTYGGNVQLSDHEDDRGLAFLYGIEDTGDTTDVISIIQLDRAQRRTLAIALLGYDEQFVNDYGATIPSAREAIGSDGRSYEPDDPTLDAPPITDADAPDEWEETGIEYRPFEREPEEDSYDPYVMGESIVPDEYAREYDAVFTQEDIDKATLAADQSAFERGYGAAVDDYRHGLWADEVEASRFNETSFRTTLLDVQEWMAFEVEDIDRAVGHDRILSEVNETLSLDPMLGITPEGTDSMEQGARWE